MGSSGVATRETWHTRGHGTEKIRAAAVEEARQAATHGKADNSVPEVRERDEAMPAY